MSLNTDFVMSKEKTPKKVSISAMQQRKKRVSLKKSDAKRKSIKKVDAIKANIAQMTNEKKLVNVSSQSKMLKSFMSTDKKPPINLNKFSSVNVTQHKIDHTRNVVLPKAKHEAGYDI
jgi:ASC-1-like (ASCH) protein